MILPPKHIYRLKKELSIQINDPVIARKLAGEADLPVSMIFFNTDAWSMWDNIFKRIIDDKTKALKLLDAVIDLFPENKVFRYYREDIDSSKLIRQVKIRNALREGRCVVFLGPDALKARNDDGQLITFNEHLCQKLSTKMFNAQIYYEPGLNNNLSYLAQCYMDDPMYAPGETAEVAFNMYTELAKAERFEQGIFDSLARLPVKLIINANPDDLLFKKLIADNSVDATMEFYDMSNYQEKIKTDNTNPPISKKRPFVYNIFGSFNNLDSILFTESQFMYFINCVVQNNPPLHPQVFTEFMEKDTYLFLGFDFEQWYFKILFQLFKIKKEDYASVSCGIGSQAAPAAGLADNIPISVYNREFFEQEFKMFFVGEDIRSFLTELVTLSENDHKN